MQKQFIRFVLFAAFVSFLPSCNPSKNINMNANSTNEKAIFPTGERGSAAYFSGTTRVKILIQKGGDVNYSIANVQFEPAARTNWHTHPAGQVLLVTEGSGFYQEKGKPAIAIAKGDTVNIPANVEHWHGAASGSHFTHIAITSYKGEENVVWLEPVTDEEYNSIQ